MYLDLERGHEPVVGADRVFTSTRWTVLIPFFNERDYLEATIASLAWQDISFDLILVDNGSTDRGAEVALAAARAHGLSVCLMTERRPGKVAALQAGLAAVRTRFVATCDADTLYPAHYLRTAQRLLDRPGCVAAGAYFIAPTARAPAKFGEAGKVLAAGALLPRLCHAGGAGQCFATEALRAAGGFDPAIWNYVLEDHELCHRVLAHGAMLYAPGLWCVPSPRDRDRASIRWTLLERLLYVAAALGAGDWFFYRFLAKRLARRRLSSVGMRERAPAPNGGLAIAASHPVR